jgi:hypothetical protein
MNTFQLFEPLTTVGSALLRSIITINDKFLRKHGKIKVEHGAHMPGMWRILPTSNTGEFLLLTAVLKGCLES